MPRPASVAIGPGTSRAAAAPMRYAETTRDNAEG
jgi:hypothetical protein